MKRTGSGKVDVSGAVFDLKNLNNHEHDRLMKKICLRFLVFTGVALFLTTGCLAKGKRQLLENPQDQVTLNESAGEKGSAALEEESTSLYEEPFFKQDSGSGSTGHFGTGSTGSSGTGPAGSGSPDGSGDLSAGGTSGGAGTPGDLPPRSDDEPPADDPPPGAPPAGDPPADPPPADEDNLFERTWDRIRDQIQFSNNPNFLMDHDFNDLLPGDNTEPEPEGPSGDRVFLDIGDMLPQP